MSASRVFLIQSGFTFVHSIPTFYSFFKNINPHPCPAVYIGAVLERCLQVPGTPKKVTYFPSGTELFIMCHISPIIQARTDI